jgi:hypothetical protein
MATQVRDAQQPTTRARHARHRFRQHQDFTNLFPVGYKSLFTDTETNADPLRRQRSGTLAGVRNETALLHFLQQLKWLLD